MNSKVAIQVVDRTAAMLAWRKDSDAFDPSEILPCLTHENIVSHEATGGLYMIRLSGGVWISASLQPHSRGNVRLVSVTVRKGAGEADKLDIGWPACRRVVAEDHRREILISSQAPA